MLTEIVNANQATPLDCFYQSRSACRQCRSLQAPDWPRQFGVPRPGASGTGGRAPSSRFRGVVMHVILPCSCIFPVLYRRGAIGTPMTQPACVLRDAPDGAPQDEVGC